jgi:hypothetical protein
MSIIIIDASASASTVERVLLMRIFYVVMSVVEVATSPE